MPAALDIPTLLLTTTLTYGCCAGALAFLRWKLPSNPGLGSFLLGNLLTITAFYFYFADTQPEWFFSHLLGNTLSVLGVLLHLDGVRKFYGRPFRIPASWAVALMTLLFYYWTLIEPSAEKRVLSIVLALFVACLAIAWTAAVHSGPGERAMSSLIVVGYGAFAFSFLARAVAIVHSPLAAALATGSTAAAAPFLLSKFAVILSTLALSLVASQRLVEQLEASRSAAEAGSKAKSEFLAVMSHEIRTPMNGVLGGAGLILSSPTDAKIRRYAETIEASGKAMLRIVDDILDFAKIEAGGLDLEPFPFDLVAEVESTVRAFRDAANLKDLTLTVEIAPALAALGSSDVVGDPGRLRQVLSNLINNALKFTESGGVEVRVKQLEPADSGDGIRRPARLRLLFEICDTGPGIPATRRERIFEPFNQGDSSTSRRFGGTGLGLSICRELVMRMGGEIGVRGRKDPTVPGTVFWLRLDLPVAELETPRPPLSDPHLVLGPSERAVCEILIAEDNAINQFVLTEMLEDLGHHVVVAGDGREALRRLEERPFDLVLMDCRMPEMDGFEATRRIRASKTITQPPIVAVTATTIQEELDACLQAGMDAVLTKPIRIKELRRALDKLLPTAGA